MTGPAPGIQTQHLLALTQRQPLFHFAAGLGHSVYLWKRNGFDWQLTSTLLFFAAKQSCVCRFLNVGHLTDSHINSFPLDSGPAFVESH